MLLLLSVVATIALAWTIAEHLYLDHAMRLLRPAAEPPRHYPSLTVIRPIRGVDVDAAANVAALLASDYPAPLELAFIFDDERDPAVPIVRAALAATPCHRDVTTRVLFAGAPPPGRTGKLHAMALGAREARGELVGFSDSDTHVAPDLLRALVDELLAHPNAGDVFAPARADGVPRTAGDAGYAILLDVWYGAPATALAGSASELPFIMGQLMIFRREALAAIGGVECADGQLVDDMYLGQRLAAAGWRNLLVPRTLHVVTGGMTLGEFWRLMRRWVLFSRSGLPLRLTLPAYLRGTTIWLGVVALFAGAAAGLWLPALLGAAVLLATCISDGALYADATGRALPLRFGWVTIGIALLGPFVAASMRFDHQVGWRGHDYALDDEARLANAAERR